LRDQKCSEGAGIFVTHGSIRFDRPRPQRLRIFHPLINPGGGKARSNMRQAWANIAFVCFRIDNVATLARILAVEKLPAQFNLALRITA
jgi:hypothetical protein